MELNNNYMDELQSEQLVRMECLITAFEHYNTCIENGIDTLFTPYELAEQMYKYILDRELPKANFN